MDVVFYHQLYGIKLKTLTCITIGCGSRFDLTKFEPIKNDWTKPIGGLWSSPVGSKLGWIHFLRDTYGLDQDTLPEHFKFIFNGLTLTINKREDLADLPWLYSQPRFRSVHYLDFEKLVKMGVDGIHLAVNGYKATRFPDYNKRALLGWDCETLLVMNPACVTQI